MVARAESSELCSTPFACSRRYCGLYRAIKLAGEIESGLKERAFTDYPALLFVRKTYGPGPRAYTGRHRPVQLNQQPLAPLKYVPESEIRSYRPDTAVNIISDPSGRYDTAVGIRCTHSSDGKP